MRLTVGIIGLGLIGGSLAKAYRRDPQVTVYGADDDESILALAELDGVIDGRLDDGRLASCDCLLLAVPIHAAEDVLTSLAPKIAAHTLVMDCCGTKRGICVMGFALAAQYGFTFVGGHPMAGTHESGFKASLEDLFDRASLVIVPPRYDDIELLDRVKTLLAPAGFGDIAVTTAERHDALIAFTSQLPHVVSSAFIKSPTVRSHRGFSAGSYRDLTRVAWLDPDMWTELFIDNQDNLLTELDILIMELQKYRDALSRCDKERLRRLLDEGRRIKAAVDGDVN